MSESNEYFIKLPDVNAIDARVFQELCSTLNWVGYERETSEYTGYAGVGLTSRSNSPEHLNDSLDIHQPIKVEIPEKTAEYNWQAISVWNENVTGPVRSLFERFNLPPLRARFAKLGPRVSVPPHVDDYSENITRIHWPIVTDDKNFFCFYSSASARKPMIRLNMLEGSAYAVNVRRPHGFINFSEKTERVHLIINVGMSYEEFSKWIQSHDLLKASN